MFILLYFPIDISDVENPPVANVVIECAIASKLGIPKNQSKEAHNNVKNRSIPGQVISIDSGQSLNWQTPDIMGGKE